VSDEYITIKKKAFSLLARREHGVEELRAKLRLKAFDDSLIDNVLADLIGENYLSDERYIEMMFRYHFERGQGPRKILSLLRQVNISEYLSQQAYREFEGDWFESASKVRAKRFGDWLGDILEKPRQIRFLSGRGFEHEHIESAFNAPSQ